MAGAILTVLGFVAGAIGTYIAWQDRDRPPTLTDWSRQALANCERRSHDLRDPSRDTVQALEALLHGLQQARDGQERPPDLSQLQRAASSMEDFADALRATTGDFRVLRRPPDSEAAIENLLSDGELLTRRMVDLATGLRQLNTRLAAIDWSRPDESAMADVVETLTRLSPMVSQATTTDIPSWRRHLQDVGLDACLPPMGSSTMPTTGGAATSDGRPGESRPPSSVDFVVDSRASGWQDTHAVANEGDLVTVTYVDGTWSADAANFPRVGPEGYPPEIDQKIYQGCKTLPNEPYGRLIGGVAGTQTRPLGRNTQFTAPASGHVMLRMNDGDRCLGDNEGSVAVTVSVAPR